MQPIRLLALSGSLRARSSNASLLHVLPEFLPPGVTLAHAPPVDSVPFFNPDLDVDPPPPGVAALRAAFAEAHGLVVSTPEYAHGIPGALKNALDWVVGSGELSKKPVLLLNAATSGGERAQAALVQVLRAMDAQVLVEASLLGPRLRRPVDAAGRVTDPGIAAALRASLAALADASRAA